MHFANFWFKTTTIGGNYELFEILVHFLVKKVGFLEYIFFYSNKAPMPPLQRNVKATSRNPGSNYSKIKTSISLPLL